MSENTKSTSTKAKSTTTKKKSKKIRKMPAHSKLLWLGLLIVAIPCCLVAYMIFNAIVDTGKPIFGDRYANDLDPAISDSHITLVETNVKNIEGIEDVHMNLMSSTLRIMVDIKDDLGVEDAKKIGTSIATVVKSVLPFDTYFTKYGNKKMYDLEIYVADKFVEGDISPTVNVMLYKTGGMPEVKTQVVSEPLNPDFVADLEAKKEQERIEAEAEAKKQAEAENITPEA